VQQTDLTRLSAGQHAPRVLRHWPWIPARHSPIGHVPGTASRVVSDLQRPRLYKPDGVNRSTRHRDRAHDQADQLAQPVSHSPGHAAARAVKGWR